MVYKREHRYVTLHKEGEPYMATHVKGQSYEFYIYRINNARSWDSVLIWNYKDKPLLKVKFSSLEKKKEVEFKAKKETSIMDIIAMIE